MDQEEVTLVNLKEYVKIVEDWPKVGISYKDISPLLENAGAYRYTIDQLMNFAKGLNVELIVGPEARGFIIGCPLAYSLGLGFVPVRKEGKLPRETVKHTYDLEYGTATLTL